MAEAIQAQIDALANQFDHRSTVFDVTAASTDSALALQGSVL
jgi:hypothetical protein